MCMLAYSLLQCTTEAGAKSYWRYINRTEALGNHGCRLARAWVKRLLDKSETYLLFQYCLYSFG